LADAMQVVQDYLDTGVAVIYQQPTQLKTTLDLLRSVTTRKKVFDVALAATLQDTGIRGLYTVNTKDFEEFSFLDVKNPLS